LTVVIEKGRIQIVEKTALIVTDGAESTVKAAESIAEVLKGYRVYSVTAQDFKGTHLLPADVCFFGTEQPDPPSFSCLSRILAHINLARRPCGIFSASAGAVEYLRGMVRDSELALYPDPFTGKGDIGAWAGKVAGISGA
jgi:hypothetical protein